MVSEDILDISTDEIANALRKMSNGWNTKQFDVFWNAK